MTQPPPQSADEPGGIPYIRPPGPEYVSAAPQPAPQPGYPAYGQPPGYPAYGQPTGYPGYGQAYGQPPGYPAYGAPGVGFGAQPPALSPGGIPLADFGPRLLAAIIDGTILGIVSGIIFVPVLIFWFSRISSNQFFDTDPNAPAPDPSQFFDSIFLPMLLLELGFGVLILIIYYVYYVEMLYKSGQTVGKRVMKIRVVPIDPTARLTRGMAAVRYLVEFVAGMVVPFLPYLDGLWQLWDKPYQQTLHDKAARTVVIKVSS